eukprot:scaffold21_cov368-Prasinococcus_capsulatus_cf.AAC.12
MRPDGDAGAGTSAGAGAGADADAEPRSRWAMAEGEGSGDASRRPLLARVRAQDGSGASRRGAPRALGTACVHGGLGWGAAVASSCGGGSCRAIDRGPPVAAPASFRVGAPAKRSPCSLLRPESTRVPLPRCGWIALGRHARGGPQ